MGTEAKFRSDLIQPLSECYGMAKFPQVRVQAIWSRVKSLPDSTYKAIADKIILNHDNFPGLNGIMAVCYEYTNQYAAKESDRLKASSRCTRCSAQGVVVVGGLYAYRCSCELGQLLYPNFAEYSGETKHSDQVSSDETMTTIETSAYIYKSPKKPSSIKDFSFVIK